MVTTMRNQSEAATATMKTVPRTKTEKKKAAAEAKANAKKWSDKRKAALAVVGGHKNRTVHALPHHTSKQRYDCDAFTSEPAMIQIPGVQESGSSFTPRCQTSATSTLSLILQITGPKGTSLEDMVNTSGIVDYDIVPLVRPDVTKDSKRDTGLYSQSTTTLSTKTRRSKYEKKAIARSTSRSSSLEATSSEKKKESKAEKKKRIEADKMKAKNWAAERKMKQRR